MCFLEVANAGAIAPHSLVRRGSARKAFGKKKRPLGAAQSFVAPPRLRSGLRQPGNSRGENDATPQKPLDSGLIYLQ